MVEIIVEILLIYITFPILQFPFPHCNSAVALTSVNNVQHDAVIRLIIHTPTMQTTVRNFPKCNCFFCGRQIATYLSQKIFHYFRHEASIKYKGIFPLNLMIIYLSIVKVINVRTEAYVNSSDTTIAKLHPIFPSGIG